MKSWKSAVRYVLISSAFAALAMSGGARGDDHGLPITTSPARGAGAGQGRLDPGAQQVEASRRDAAHASSTPAAAPAPMTRTSASSGSTMGHGAPAAPAGGVPSSWMSEAKQRVRDMEYEITWQDKTSLPDSRPAWQAPNRAQGFRTYFTPEGIHVVPRIKAASSWRWELSLAGYGQGAKTWSVPSAALSTSSNRIDYDRGPIDESYENTPKGLEQVFTLQSPPGEGDEGGTLQQEIPGPATSVSRPGGAVRAARLDGASPQERSDPAGWIHIDLTLSGDLSPKPSEDGHAFDFVTRSGAVALQYGSMQVSDARGQSLPAWMEGFSSGNGRGIRLVVDASRAIYPITVDPLVLSWGRDLESNQANAEFGYSVATAGDVNGDGFSDVIVGADLYDNGQIDEGRAFVFLGPTLSSIPSWTAESDQAGAEFGYSVAPAGDINGDGFSDVIVGAPFYTNGQTSEGRAYLYLGSASGLAATPAWTAESDFQDARFGSSVATAGDVDGDGYSDVIVGAPTYCPSGGCEEGQAYLFLGSASGLATTAAWTAIGAISSNLGKSVATAGDVNGDGFSDVIIGANRFSNGETTEGEALVYLGSASGLAATPSWTAESNQVDAEFGWSVSTAGDVNGDGYADVIVGAPFFDIGTGTDNGEAYVYLGSATGLAATPAWTNGGLSLANFGWSVGTAGDFNGDGYADIIIGSPSASSGGEITVCMGSTGTVIPLLADCLVVDGVQAGEKYGWSVATAGDVNGDGFSEIVVGSPLYDNGQTDEGGAEILGGSGEGLPLGDTSPGTIPWAGIDLANWVGQGAQTGANFGVSVASAGDVNGDGFSDVIVGADLYDNGETDEGAAFLYLGSASGPSTSPDWSAEGNQAAAHFGHSVATAGDVNGDGYSDVIVGAPLFDGLYTDEGRAFVYLGSASGLAPTPVWTGNDFDEQAGAHFGWSVASAGDVNGDGFSDIIVGSPLYDDSATDEGAAWVWLGSASGPGFLPSWAQESGEAGAQYGFSVASAGDVNGDGYSDVVAGAPYFDSLSVTDNGQIFLSLGSASGLAAAPSATEPGAGFIGGAFGYSVATAGDVNGDGLDDVIVGAPFAGSGSYAEVLYGNTLIGSMGFGFGTVDYLRPSGGSFNGVGYSVSTAGDVNGDGLSDVLVGAADPNNGGGWAYLWEGPVESHDENWGTVGSTTYGASVASAGDVNGDGFSDVIIGDSRWEDPNFSGFGGVAVLIYGGGYDHLTRIPRQARTDATAPVALLGNSDSGTGIRLLQRGITPAGRGKIRLQWEVKPLGQYFNGTGRGVSGSQDTGAPAPSGGSSTDFSEIVSGLAPGAPQHWIARIVSDDPFFPHSRWMSLAGSAPRATKFRTPGDMAVGDFAWQDLNGDGIQQGGEPGLANVIVAAYDGVTGDFVTSAISDASGAYQIASGLHFGHSYFLRFFPPSGYVATLANQGGDDSLDSDVDPVTQSTAVFTAGDPSDATIWDGGFIPFCIPPDEAMFISGMTVGPSNETILTFEDFNQPSQVTGYNVYRSDTASTSPSTWPQVASDVVDEDAATPNIQWSDTSGDISPTGIWYYEVTAYNDRCPAEGPF